MKSSDILLSLVSEHLEVWKVGNEVCVDYYHADVKDGYFLTSAFGMGPDFESACDDYLAKIRGKRLVFNAYSDSRREVVVLG